MAAIVVAGALLLGGCSSSAATAGSSTHDHAGSAAASADAAAGQIRLLEPAAFEAESAGRVLINVHIPDEGSLPGTTLDLPYDQVAARTADLPSDKATALAIYCMSGNMSATAGRDLLDLGYSDVVELDGGMQAWRSSGRTLLPAGS